MSFRVKITLPDNLGTQLDSLAQTLGEPVSRVAGHFVRAGLADETPGREHAPRAVRPAPSTSGPAVWLEPFGNDRRAWRREAWAAVLALCARYPHQLARLEDGWWRQPARVELLCALAAWRDAIDHAGQDPREELAFHHQLDAIQQMLEQTPGVGADVFTPGAPPSDWLDS
jgi:hypothetical protein